MARPKGVIQKRNESKYWTPDGVKLKLNQLDIYNKDTKLIFIDDEFGEFVSSFKALQQANASTHPNSVKKRRESTNLSKYGVANAGAAVEVRKKARSTMKEKYGVEHALQNKEFLNKSKNTLKSNYGVESPMHSPELRKKQISTTITNHGVSNPMFSEKIKLGLKESNLKKYGVENPASLPETKEKYLNTLLQNGNFFVSEGELQIKKWLESIGITAESSFIGGKNPKQIDLKIKEYNIAIEYNGAFWHSEYNKKMYPKYHLDKTNIAKEAGLDLIHIFDFEWKNKCNQVKSFLRSKLGKNEIRIYGRECEIRQVPKKEAKYFLNQYHILGSCSFIEAIGLYFNDELLSVITIGKHHRKNKEYVISRYCVKENYTVAGGITKLTKFASNKYSELITWIDLRWSNGSSWIKNGWVLDGILPPDYFYYDSKKAIIISKQSRQKALVNTPIGMTEHEHSLKDGLYRVYDCGKLRLVYKK